MTCRKIVNQSGFTLIEIIATVVILAVFSTIILTLIAGYYTGTGGIGSLIKGSDALGRMYQSSNLSNVMGNIYADYRPYPVWQKTTSYTVGNNVFPVGMNGRFYTCTSCTGPCTSGTQEPTWNDSGSTSDGSVTWNAGVWHLSTQYKAGAIVIPTAPNGHFYLCVTAGMSGSSEPTPWPMTGITEVNDGAVQWMELLVYLNQRIGARDPVNMQSNIWYGQYYVLQNRFVIFVSNTIQPIGAGDPWNILEVQIQSVGTNSNKGEQMLTTFLIANEHGQ